LQYTRYTATTIRIKSIEASMSSLPIVNAHFDGQVIVPDQPLPLLPGEKLRVTIEREQLVEPKQERRQAGSARGQVWMSPDFDALIPEFEENK
jgi:hypothetical protein